MTPLTPRRVGNSPLCRELHRISLCIAKFVVISWFEREPSDPRIVAISERMKNHPFNRLSAYAPIYMSVIALLAVAKAMVNFKRFGPALDEDGPWHVFMLMMFLQLPIIFYFVVRYRDELGKVLPIFAAQLSMWVLSLTAAWYFPGIY